MTDLTTSPASDPLPSDLTKLSSQLRTASEKTQMQLIQQLADPTEAGLDVLMEFLMEKQSQPATVVMGKAYQLLYQADSPRSTQFLQTHFPKGIVPLNSERNLDYHPLQQRLAQQDFQEADRQTSQFLCQLAGEGAIERKWVYFTEVDNFPKSDLQTLNNLWLVHSEGKFGFSVQREIWLSLSKNWEKMWEKIGWKVGNNWTRYPNEFTWNLSAPKGHLPLSNQLRGVRVIEKLLNHPTWTQKEPVE